MKPRLIIIFLFIVLMPLGLLAGLGVMLARDERQRLELHFRDLLTGQLRDVEAQLARFMQLRERQLEELTRQAPRDSEALRTRARAVPWIRQAFLLTSDGTLSYPSPRAELSETEREFLDRTREIWQRGDLFLSSTQQAGLDADRGAEPVPQQSSAKKGPSPESTGWHAWYWGNGLNLIFWNRREDGSCVGMELDRTRLLADMIGQLPDTDPRRAKPAEGRIQLRDSNNILLHQWGAYEASQSQRPAASLALFHPLGSWRLNYFIPTQLLAPGRGGLLFNLLAGLAALGLALIGLAVYFYRENTRAIREAAERVSFVNQVSHELKTPLTNIRLYAELMQEYTAEGDETAGRHLGVIVAECERLSRLIANVLTFSRSRRQTLRLHRGPVRIEEMIQHVLDRFRPSLERRGIQICFNAAAAPVVLAAADAIEQILGNLLGNVEKYAAAGGRVEIASCYADTVTTITVADQGPGIPPAEHEKIFKPFYRIHSALNEGVSGAGIGLSIARELARLHGGDLTLASSDVGACFEVRLNTPPEENKRQHHKAHNA